MEVVPLKRTKGNRYAINRSRNRMDCKDKPVHRYRIMFTRFELYAIRGFWLGNSSQIVLKCFPMKPTVGILAINLSRNRMDNKGKLSMCTGSCSRVLNLCHSRLLRSVIPVRLYGSGSPEVKRRIVMTRDRSRNRKDHNDRLSMCTGSGSRVLNLSHSRVLAGKVQSECMEVVPMK
jgi:hypothetical protein